MRELILIALFVVIIVMAIAGVFLHLTKNLASNNLKRTRSGINAHANALIKELNKKR